ncbi:MAG: GntR family transcriptional regulator [Desulfuromusa sp.]|nr:GntR family transcriptional regulator [Desulfuromusa sp.]
MSVVDTVLAEIGGLGLTTGDRLPSERKLAERCEISRSSVRNALKELMSKRVLDVKQGSGYLLSSDFALQQALARKDTEWTMGRIQQVFEARILVAAKVTELGSEEMTGKSLQELEDCLVDLGKAVVNMDIQSIEQLHNRFINIIHERCLNPEYIRMLNEVKIPHHYIVSVLQAAGGEERNAYFSEHVNLFQAVKKRNHVLAKDTCIQLNNKLSGLFEKYAYTIFN